MKSVVLNLLVIAPTASFSLNTNPFHYKLSRGRCIAAKTKSKLFNNAHTSNHRSTHLSLLSQRFLQNDRKRVHGCTSNLFSTIEGENSLDFPTEIATQPTRTQHFLETFSSIAQNSFSNVLPERPIASGQKQIPLMERIAKGMHDESAPWIVSLIFPTLVSLIAQDASAFHFNCFVELCFLCFCAIKLFTKFDVPSTNPQPLLNDRNWDYVYNSIWEAQETLANKRDFLSSWFYDTPFERLRREDIISFLAWLHFGIQEENLTPSQRNEVVSTDLPRLEYEVNNGKTLPLRSKGEEELVCVRFNLEPLRFRHKPLFFYIITHGTRLFATKALEDIGFSYNPPKNPTKDLGYFFRPGTLSTNSEASKQTPLVFVHGVGGISYYFNLIKDLGDKSEAPIILVDLPFISLQVSDDIPLVADQVKSVCSILDKKIGAHKKATFVGHSFGSLILSWMVQSCPHRVANCVFVDPICFQLHLRSILFNFHFQRVDESIQKGKRWENPFSTGSFINMAGTEMHTNNAMLRHFWWATNVLWPADLDERNIPTSIMLSEYDDIVPSAEIQQLFQKYKEKKESVMNKIQNHFPVFSNMENKMLLRANMIHGAHGEFVFDENLRNKVVKTVLAMMRLNNITEKKN